MNIFENIVGKGENVVDSIFCWTTIKGTSLNIFILHRLRNRFSQIILISLDYAFWELHQ